MWDHVLTKKTDGTHHRIMVKVVELHQAQDPVGADLGVTLELVDAGLWVSENHHVVLIDVGEGPITSSRLLDERAQWHGPVGIYCTFLLSRQPKKEGLA